MDDADRLGLLRVPPEEYGNDYREHLLEQYKLYVEMADRISARRDSMNTYFLSANTLLVAIAGLLASEAGGVDAATIAWRCAVPFSGITLCVVWYFLISSYRQMNSGKFKVVHELERLLPTAPYDAEWDALGRGEKPKVYWPFTHIEPAVPLVFGALYVALLMIVFPWERLSL